MQSIPPTTADKQTQAQKSFVVVVIKEGDATGRCFFTPHVTYYGRYYGTCLLVFYLQDLLGACVDDNNLSTGWSALLTGKPTSIQQ